MNPQVYVILGLLLLILYRVRSGANLKTPAEWRVMTGLAVWFAFAWRFGLLSVVHYETAMMLGKPAEALVVGVKPGKDALFHPAHLALKVQVGDRPKLAVVPHASLKPEISTGQTVAVHLYETDTATWVALDHDGGYHLQHFLVIVGTLIAGGFAIARELKQRAALRAAPAQGDPA